MYRIALRVTGVDLDDDITCDVTTERLGHLTWLEVDGRTLAVLHTSACPVGEAVQAARQIFAHLTGARVLDVDQDLVGVSDIAKRVGVTREAVRLWVDGKRGPGGFPAPVGSAGGGERGSMRLWQWATVSDWLRHFGLHDDEETPSATQVAEINAALHRVLGPADREWQHTSKGKLRVPRLNHAGQTSATGTRSGRIPVKVDYGTAMGWHERRSLSGGIE
ncbi:hypothetical protein [Actinoplanes derwentensis]|uniref:Uncharacterized protein n=1 Tax=Actinoplanes derwentensis TaxID=113562 RepID=A0A1H1RK46_9ACTN|nr:hypothetical protein [Actinoplanes derwentensis]GID84446.1 hypothetical protein Ade03nite_33700 [Actinoplanes derwentensis]SDS36095.1 hypothetical protein SAMN04489716_0612 [Actinoplanes derwentensis]